MSMNTGRWGVIESCHTYDNKAWESFPSMIVSRYYAKASPSPYPNEEHSFLVTGGGDGQGLFNSGEILTDEGWQPWAVTLPVIIVAHCVVLINSTTLFMIGGRQDDVILSPRAHFFNSESEQWTEGPSLKVGRVYHSCGILRNGGEYRIVVAGGMINVGSILEYQA